MDFLTAFTTPPIQPKAPFTGSIRSFPTSGALAGELEFMRVPATKAEFRKGEAWELITVSSKRRVVSRITLLDIRTPGPLLDTGSLALGIHPLIFFPVRQCGKPRSTR